MKKTKKHDMTFEEITQTLTKMYKGRRSKGTRIIAYNLLHLLLEVQAAGQEFVNAPRHETVSRLQATLDDADIYLGILKSLSQKDLIQTNSFVEGLPDSLLANPLAK